MFYIAQIFGVAGLIVLIISFQKDNKKRLLKYQIISSLFFALQYLFLNGLSGCLMNIMTMIRNYIFSKYEKNVPIYCLIIIITFMSLLSLVSYENLYSLLPTIAVVSYSIAVWQNNLKITRVVELFSCSLFIIYNIKYVAISGLISTILEACFVLIAIYRLDIKANKLKRRKKKQTRKS